MADRWAIMVAPDYWDRGTPERGGIFGSGLAVNADKFSGTMAVQPEQVVTQRVVAMSCSFQLHCDSVFQLLTSKRHWTAVEPTGDRVQLESIGTWTQLS